MRLEKLPSVIIFLLIISTFGFGQETVEDENWIREVTGPYCKSYPRLTYRFKNFTKEDVAKAKQKLDSIQQQSIDSEWEGLYYWDVVGVGDSKIIWDKQAGFLSFYCYHYLDRLDYGKVKEFPDFIELVSEKPQVSPQKKNNLLEQKFIKIKFGDKHFLVPENNLVDFMDLTAGLNTEINNFLPYLAKEDEIDKTVYGIPILSSKYKHLLRYPIEAKIISIGIRQIIPNSQSTKEYNFDDIHYSITLDAGKDKNIEIGMDFFVEDMNEWVKITEVYQKISVGYFRRDFDENMREQCRDGRGGSEQLTPCKEIKIGMKVRTKTSL